MQEFWALPEAKRDRLRRLDKEFHQLDANTQKRLWKAVERYGAWLERLPEDQRRQIETTADRHERLRLIREIRQRQWFERLPRKVRDNLLQLPPEERTERIVQLREQERLQRRLWQRPLGAGAAGRPAKPPAHRRDLPPEVRDYVEKNLLPRLSADEKRQYEEAEGQPEFPRTVKHLADLHPVLPPLPPPNRPVTRYEDLPDKAKSIAGPKPFWERRVDAWKKLQQVEGVWPEWARTFVTLLTDEQRRAMPPLGASRPNEFPPAVQTFIETTLRQAVKTVEFHRLRQFEGKWPEYPLRLLDLALKHNLTVPGMSLPGAAELWSSMR